MTTDALEEDGFVRVERRSPENGNKEKWVRREVLEKAGGEAVN
jgi:hypothetical protein